MSDINIIKEYKPGQLDNLNSVNLKAANGTAVKSQVIGLAEYTNFLVSLISTNVEDDGAAGAASISVELYADDGTTQLGADIDLLTSIDTTSSQNTLVVFGRDFAAAKFGSGTLGANIAALRFVRRARIVVTVDTQSDATGANTAVLRLQCQP